MLPVPDAVPVGWLIACLRDVVEEVETVDPGQSPDRQFTYVDIGAINNTSGSVVAPRRVSGADAPSRARQAIREHDVLFSTVRPYLRAIAMSPSLQNGVASTGFCVLRAAEGVDPRFLFRVVRSDAFIEHVLPFQRGSSYPAVRDADILDRQIPLPPKGEQARIADRLDELLTDLDQAVGELIAAQKKLTQYRQSLLKAAVEGALTAEWRAQNPPRPQRHELAATMAAPEWLPSGWAWTSVEFLPSVSMSNGRSVPTSADGAKVLRLTAVRNGRIDLSEYKHGAWSDAEAAPHAVRAGDLLVVRGNGSLSLVGRAGVVPKVVEQIAYPDTLIRVRVSSQVVRPEWLALLWDSSLVRDHLERRARTSAGIYKISQPDIASAPVPLPSLAEQDAALALWDEHLERIAAMEHSMLAARRMATAQRQNILRAAFSGQLVPQDPNDEPAGALLARIAQARLGTERSLKLRKPRKPRTIKESA